MANEMSRSLAVVLADGDLYETAPSALRARLTARLEEAASHDAGNSARLAAADGSNGMTGDDAGAGVGAGAEVDAAVGADVAGAAPGMRRGPTTQRDRPPRGRHRFFGIFPDRRIGWSFAGGGLVGVALSLLLGVTVLRDLPWLGLSATPSPSTLFEQQIVASHVRALISSREMDVLSSDQHTVKPWFNGRIDYAPPVVDPKAYGFPLVGGRLDYVGNRPVAVMVYRYLKHPIDLYVFPDAGDGATGTAAVSADTAQSVMSKQGYSIIEWKRSGMIFWAITDASMPNLKSFVDAVKHMT